MNLARQKTQVKCVASGHDSNLLIGQDVVFDKKEHAGLGGFGGGGQQACSAGVEAAPRGGGGVGAGELLDYRVEGRGVSSRYKPALGQ